MQNLQSELEAEKIMNRLQRRLDKLQAEKEKIQQQVAHEEHYVQNTLRQQVCVRL